MTRVSKWGSVDYIPETVRTRKEAKKRARQTRKRVRFTECGGGFVQVS